ncbi:MAG TPA: hypothetical protein VN806_07050 [Caulobacteraceae bacterium]|nr:hypothetical protein [Caulobacteraceae bacterium]
MDELLAQARAAAERGEVDAAIALCTEAHGRRPERLEPITLALQILDRTDTGDRLVAWAELGLARAPGEVFYQAAMAYGRDLRGEWDVAAPYWRRAATLRGEPSAFAFQLGRSLMYAGDLGGAATVLERALGAGAPDPLKSDPERMLGEAKLKGADITGFKLYQARDVSDGGAFALPHIPTWRGEDLAGRTLLVSHHLGYGDQLMLAPLVAQLAERAARLVITCDVAVREVLAHSLPQARFGGMGRAALPNTPASPELTALVADVHPAFHASLLGACAPLTIDEVTRASTARLSAPPEAAARARLRLGNIRRRYPGRGLIGLAFDAVQHREPSMNPVVRAHAFRRSVPLALVAPLTEALAEHCHFVILHPDAHRARIGATPPNSSVLEGDLADFSQTAGVIQALDGVVAVDSSVANLAAKLGGPSWILLAWSADWRWGQGGARTPWFPTATLFRQPVPGDWASVMRVLAEALRLPR